MNIIRDIRDKYQVCHKEDFKFWNRLFKAAKKCEILRAIIMECFLCHILLPLKPLLLLDVKYLEHMTLPKEQRIPGIKDFDSFNTFISKQKLQQASKSWSNFSLVLFGKGQEIST